MKLAIIVPVYNEAATVVKLIDRLRSVPLDKEIIVVDDGSTDGTSGKLSGIAAPELRIIRHEQNRGKGAAIRTAIAYVTADAVAIQDADLEYVPEELPQLLRPIEDGIADVVYGSRFLGYLDNMRLVNYVANKVLAWTATVLFGRRITDEATCYKLFRTDVLKSLPLACERFEFCPEVTGLVLRRGIPILELPITYHGRTVMAGKKIRLNDAFSAFFTLIRVRFSRLA